MDCRDPGKDLKRRKPEAGFQAIESKLILDFNSLLLRSDFTPHDHETRKWKTRANTRYNQSKMLSHF